LDEGKKKNGYTESMKKCVGGPPREEWRLFGFVALLGEVKVEYHRSVCQVSGSIIGRAFSIFLCPRATTPRHATQTRQPSTDLHEHYWLREKQAIFYVL
jgi:hypothetical protein